MGHETSIVSDFIAIFLILVFVFKFVEAAKSGKKIDLDNVELFRIQEIQTEVHNPTTAPITQSKRKKKRKPKQKEILQSDDGLGLVPVIDSTPVVDPKNRHGYTKLQQDCFDALKSLGVKTIKERKFIVNKAFNEHNPKTIQDFLKVALH